MREKTVSSALLMSGVRVHGPRRYQTFDTQQDHPTDAKSTT